MDRKLLEGLVCVEKVIDEKTKNTVAKIKYHYPDSFSAILKEFRDLPEFCFPDSVSFKVGHPEHTGNSTHTFVLTAQNGERLYCCCFRTYMHGKNGRYELPRRFQTAMCVVSKVAFFSVMQSVTSYYHGLCLLGQNVNGCLPATQSSAFQFLNFISNYVLKPAAAFSLTGEWVAFKSSAQLAMQYNIFLPSHGGALHKEVKLVPLFEVLSTSKFLCLLSAILSERRVLFVSDDVEVVSAAVVASVAMIYPFKWHHILVPLLPSKLSDYVSAPMPYLIGIRRNMLKVFRAGVLDEVVIVDVDSGDIATSDRIPIRDFVGDSGSRLKLVSENIDRAKAKATEFATKFVSRGTSLFSGKDKDIPIGSGGWTGGSGSSGSLINPNFIDQGPKDVAGYMVTEMRKCFYSKPGSVNLTNVVGKLSTNANIVANSNFTVNESANNSTTGNTTINTTTAETVRDKWAPEAERVIRENILIFFVYLFGCLRDYKVNDFSFGASSSDKNAPNVNSSTNSSGGSKSLIPKEGFQKGDSRGGFDIPSYLVYRQHMGDSKALQEFTSEFIHTQMFERFCAELIVVLEAKKQTGDGSGTTNSVNSMDEFETACSMLSSNRQKAAPTVMNVVKIVQKLVPNSSVADGESVSRVRVVHSDLHPLTLQWTAVYPGGNGSTAPSIDLFSNDSVYRNMQPNFAGPPTECPYLSGGLFERVCKDTYRSNECGRILDTLLFRLKETKTQLGSSVFNNLIVSGNGKVMSGVRALELLYFLLLHGSEQVFSVGVGAIPILRHLVHCGEGNTNIDKDDCIDTNLNSSGDTRGSVTRIQESTAAIIVNSSSALHAELRYKAQTVVKLLLDHDLLLHARRLARIRQIDGSLLQYGISQSMKNKVELVGPAGFVKSNGDRSGFFADLHDRFQPKSQSGGDSETGYIGRIKAGVLLTTEPTKAVIEDDEDEEGPSIAIQAPYKAVTGVPNGTVDSKASTPSRTPPPFKLSHPGSKTAYNSGGVVLNGFGSATGNNAGTTCDPFSNKDPFAASTTNTPTVASNGVFDPFGSADPFASKDPFASTDIATPGGASMKSGAFVIPTDPFASQSAGATDPFDDWNSAAEVGHNVGGTSDPFEPSSVDPFAVSTSHRIDNFTVNPGTTVTTPAPEFSFFPTKNEVDPFAESGPQDPFSTMPLPSTSERNANAPVVMNNVGLIDDPFAEVSHSINAASGFMPPPAQQINKSNVLSVDDAFASIHLQHLQFNHQNPHLSMNGQANNRNGMRLSTGARNDSNNLFSDLNVLKK